MTAKGNVIISLLTALILLGSCSTAKTVDQKEPEISRQDWENRMFDSSNEDALVCIGSGQTRETATEDVFHNYWRYFSLLFNHNAVDYSATDGTYSSLSYIAMSSFMVGPSSMLLDRCQLLGEYFDEEYQRYYLAYSFPTTLYLELVLPTEDAFSLEYAIRNAVESIEKRIPSNGKIAIINIASSSAETSEFILEELSTQLVGTSFYVVDRSSLDAIRAERKFQLSGDVDDDSIISIGKFVSADVVITGSITGENEYQRLRIKALDVKTAKLLIQKNIAY